MTAQVWHTISKNIIDVKDGLHVIYTNDENTLVSKLRRITVADDYDDPIDIEFTSRNDFKTLGPHFILMFTAGYLLSEWVEIRSTNKRFSLSINVTSGLTQVLLGTGSSRVSVSLNWQLTGWHPWKILLSVIESGFYLLLTRWKNITANFWGV